MRALWLRMLLTRMADALRHPAAGWLACAAAVLAIVLWLSGGTRTPAQARPALRAMVDVPLGGVQGAGLQPAMARRLVVTVRWGHPVKPPKQAAATAWDGYVALDCGEIVDAAPLAWEPGSGDHLGPVVRGEAGDQRIYWRSATAADWDGLRLRVQTCPADDGNGDSQLRIVTPARTYVARLAWSEDDFVSLPTVGGDGSLDVHIAGDHDTQPVRPDRISWQPPAAPIEPMAAVDDVGRSAKTPPR